MSGSKDDLIKYRLKRAKETFEDAFLLANNYKWNSSINRLYYSAYYAIMALLLKHELKSTTHNGAKHYFSEYFVKPGIVSKELGKFYSQLFSWRQKGDYDDFFDFNEENVLPYFKPVEELINIVEKLIEE